MNLRHMQTNIALRDRLASEYALGTLKGGARRRFESWMLADPGTARAVAGWQARLMPMAELATPVQPPVHVWTAVEQRLGLAAAGAAHRPARAGWASLFDSLAFWRRLGVGAVALATVLVAVLVAREPAVSPPAASYVATLTDDKAQAVLVVAGSPAQHKMTIRVVAQQDIGPDKSLELWAIPKSGPPESLGLVASQGVVTLDLPEHVTPESTPVLAISLEPKGGSGNKYAPSGPVLFKGSWLRV